MTQGRMPISSGRYVPLMVNGTRQWVRDQVTLQADILALLRSEGPMPKKRIITALSTAQAAIEAALAALLAAEKTECFRAMSARNRLDEHWCLAGQSPASPGRAGSTCYNAVAILKAMQHHAASIHAGSANK